MADSSQVMDKMRTTSSVGRRGEPMLRGVHHLALNTDDLKSTLDFYVKVLGMPLLGGLLTGLHVDAEMAKSRGNPPFANIPHYFVDMGGDSTLAFFEYPRGAVPKGDRDTLGAMQHVAFACSPSRFAEMQRRLRDNNVEITFGPTAIVEPNIQSMYFYDPNGIRLEIMCDVDGDDDELHVVKSFTLTKEAMRRELRTITDDEAWITEIVEYMPEPDPRFVRERFHP